MIKEIILPDLGEGIEGAEVSEVSVASGDTVSPDDTILVLESDKASMEIPAEVSGIVKDILVAAGDELKTGHLLMKIEAPDTNDEDGKPETAVEEEIEPTADLKPEISETPPIPALEDSGSMDHVFASPGVRRLARELGINLQMIQGTGLKGRITKDDLNAYIKLQMAMSSGTLPAPQSEIDFSQWGDIEVQNSLASNASPASASNGLGSRFHM